MSEHGCEVCKILLDRAADAIAANARAVARLENAVVMNHETDVTHLQMAVRLTGFEREAAVTQYELHRAGHRLKIMTAGSGSIE